MKNIIQKIKNRKGTTLVEMMIAFTLFGILITITVVSFKQSLELQQLSVQLLEAHDSVGLLFEQISREVRTSTELTMDHGAISFMNQYDEGVEYYLDGGMIYRNGFAVTTNNPNIRILGFDAEVIRPGTDYRRLTMSIKISVRDRKGVEYASVLQTTVSPRFYE